MWVDAFKMFLPYPSQTVSGTHYSTENTWNDLLNSPDCRQKIAIITLGLTISTKWCKWTILCTLNILNTLHWILLLYLQTQIRFPIGGERVTGHGSKLTNSPGRTKLTNSLGKQQLELSTRTWSGRAPWNRGKFVEIFIICSIFELGGITNHLMTDPSGNS